jgi:hypothetical protein
MNFSGYRQKVRNRDFTRILQACWWHPLLQAQHREMLPTARLSNLFLHFGRMSVKEMKSALANMTFNQDMKQPRRWHNVITKKSKKWASLLTNHTIHVKVTQCQSYFVIMWKQNMILHSNGNTEIVEKIWLGAAKQSYVNPDITACFEIQTWVRKTQ